MSSGGARLSGIEPRLSRRYFCSVKAPRPTNRFERNVRVDFGSKIATIVLSHFQRGLVFGLLTLDPERPELLSPINQLQKLATSNMAEKPMSSRLMQMKVGQRILQQT
jgi:hypothetical protein